MKPNLFMKRKLEIGLTLLIGMSAFWGCNNDLAPIRQNQALPPDLSKHSVFESFSPDSGGIGTHARRRQVPLQRQGRSEGC